MKAALRTLVSLALGSTLAFAQDSALIIESQSFHLDHDMDDEWEEVATAAGFVVTRGTQGDLTDAAALAAADVLIISSGSIPLPTAAMDLIRDFVAGGGNLYLQGEGQTGLDTNELFKTIVIEGGANFHWGAVWTGNRGPVTVSGPFASPTQPAPLDFFWWAVPGSGTGPGISVNLHDSAGLPVGWSFDFPFGGHVAHTTDQNWVSEAGTEDRMLMTNILEWLRDGGPVGTAYCEPGGSNSISPNGARLRGLSHFGEVDASFLITEIPSQPGLMFAGPTPTNFAFGCGKHCIGGVLLRGDVQVPSGNSLQTTFDMTAPGANHVQYWYRDPANFASCGSTINLSNALMD